MMPPTPPRTKSPMKSTITSSYEVAQSAYEVPDAVMPPKPPRAKSRMKSTITSSYEVAQSVYEVPDALMLDHTEESQPEVKVKPVPLPRSKLQPKSQSHNSTNTVDSADTASDPTSTVSSQISEYPVEYKKPHPVRPPPRPPVSKCMISSPATVDISNQDMTSLCEPTAKSPAVTTERIQSPSTLRPERPPPPSNYYSARSTMRIKPESCVDESQQSSGSYLSEMKHSPASPAAWEEEANLFGTCTTATDSTDSTDGPAVPPRLRQSSVLCSASLCGTSPTQTRPPPPSFNPPPPPPAGRLSDTVYSELEHRPYLDVLPEDVDKMTKEKPTLRHQSGHFSTQTTEDTEDINGMLRWLKKVSKSDAMASSMYDLSIEEELRSFSQRTMNVRKALRLYNLLMMKRSESLRNTITEFSSISDSLDKMKKKSKTMEIAGGTTGAVGGVTAVLGIALAPMTMGASLIATAIGAGMVASAGGIGAHNAKAKKKIVNKMTVEKLVYEYKGNIVDLEHCLGFILSEMNELQRHDIARLQRAGAQTDALKMAHLSHFVFRSNKNKDRGTYVGHTAGMSSERLLLAFTREMDQYFKETDDQKLRKSYKSRFSGRIRLLAENLQEELYNLNRMWEMFG